MLRWYVCGVHLSNKTYIIHYTAFSFYCTHTAVPWSVKLFCCLFLSFCFLFPSSRVVVAMYFSLKRSSIRTDNFLVSWILSNVALILSFGRHYYNGIYCVPWGFRVKWKMVCYASTLYKNMLFALPHGITHWNTIQSPVTQDINYVRKCVFIGKESILQEKIDCLWQMVLYGKS